MLRDFKLSLVVGVTQSMTVDGDFFGIYESESDVYISLDNGPWIKRGGGDYQSGAYNTIAVKTLVNQNCILMLGKGNFSSSTQKIAVTSVSEILGGNSNPAIDDVVIPAGNSLQIVGVNNDRKSVLIKSLYSNDPTAIIRVGVGATAIKGVELIAGDALPPLETTGAVDAFNPSAFDVTVSIMEVNRV